MSTSDKEKQRLRNYLNPTLTGKNVDNVLESLAQGTLNLINNVEAVTDMYFITTAVEEYLEKRLAEYNLIKSENVGLSDDIFREIGIEVINSKQIRSLINKVLEIMYGYEFTRATSSSTELENYNLEDGDTLSIEFDEEEEVTITFLSTQFSNINNATAQEVADAITRNLSKLGRTGSAIAKDSGSGGLVTLISDTIGPSSSVKVTGGKAQNKLKFSEIRNTSGDSSTQWTLTQISGGKIRMTWTAGANPSVGRVKKNDYVNIYGSNFSTVNKGRFWVTKVQGGTVGNAYIEYENYNGIAEVVLQGNSEGVLFFNPKKIGLISKLQFATSFQTESNLLEIFIPPIT
jgi:hypothetical protein